MGLPEELQAPVDLSPVLIAEIPPARRPSGAVVAEDQAFPRAEEPIEEVHRLAERKRGVASPLPAPPPDRRPLSRRLSGADGGKQRGRSGERELRGGERGQATAEFRRLHDRAMRAQKPRIGREPADLHPRDRLRVARGEMVVGDDPVAESLEVAPHARRAAEDVDERAAGEAALPEKILDMAQEPGLIPDQPHAGGELDRISARPSTQERRSQAGSVSAKRPGRGDRA